jgi:hypothetical protein
MNELTIVTPETKDLQIASGDMLGQAALLNVVDDTTCIAGSDILLEITRRKRTVEERFKEPCDAAFKAHRSLTALRDSVLVPFKQAQETIDRKIRDYRVQVRRKQEAEAAAALKAANEKAEAERLAKAEKQMDAGDLKGCEQTLKAPLPPANVRIETQAAPTVKGLSFRTEWFFEITDPDAVPRNLCSPDEKRIRAMVKGMQGATNIPGIRVWSSEVSSKRAGAA